MSEITNEYMMEMLGKSKNYTIVLLKEGPNTEITGVDQLIWEHARGNFELRAKGLLSIVCPVTEENIVKGVGIFNADKESVKAIMDEDPAVKQGLFAYEMLTVKSFPGDALG